MGIFGKNRGLTFGKTFSPAAWPLPVKAVGNSMLSLDSRGEHGYVQFLFLDPCSTYDDAAALSPVSRESGAGAGELAATEVVTATAGEAVRSSGRAATAAGFRRDRTARVAAVASASASAAAPSVGSALLTRYIAVASGHAKKASGIFTTRKRAAKLTGSWVAAGHRKCQLELARHAAQPYGRLARGPDHEEREETKQFSLAPRLPTIVYWTHCALASGPAVQKLCIIGHTKRLQLVDEVFDSELLLQKYRKRWQKGAKWN